MADYAAAAMDKENPIVEPSPSVLDNAPVLDLAFAAAKISSLEEVAITPLAHVIAPVADVNLVAPAANIKSGILLLMLLMVSQFLLLLCLQTLILLMVLPMWSSLQLILTLYIV